MDPQKIKTWKTKMSNKIPSRPKSLITIDWIQNKGRARLRCVRKKFGMKSIPLSLLIHQEMLIWKISSDTTKLPTNLSNNRRTRPSTKNKKVIGLNTMKSKNKEFIDNNYFSTNQITIFLFSLILAWLYIFILFYLYRY